MSDEIKEKDIDYILEKELSPDRYCYIHNYIIDLKRELERYKHYSKTTGIEELMQENESLQGNNQAMQEEMARVWEENERLKEKLNRYNKYTCLRSKIMLDDYKSRCEKAIEYIKGKI